MDLPLTDVLLYGYDSSVGGIGSPSDWQFTGLDHFDGTDQAAFTEGTPPYLDTPDAGTSYLYSLFPWNVAALFGADPSATQVTAAFQVEIPEVGFLNFDAYIVDTSGAAAGTGSALATQNFFYEGTIGDWVTLTFDTSDPSVLAAAKLGHLALIFRPELRVSWAGVTTEGGRLPLMQRQRDDGLRGVAAWNRGTSRQASNRARGYL